MDPLISVIVPVYKVEKYLDRCVESIVNQTYTNLEIILVDDGSPDNCPQMCDAWAKKDSRIKVIHKENGGLSSARNVGLDNMNGEYVYFIDSDDYIESNTLQKLLDTLLTNMCEMAFGKYIRIYDDDSLNEKVECTNEINIFNEDSFWNYYIYNNDSAFDSEIAVNMIISCNKLIKSSVFRNLRFDVGRINEDVIIIHKLISLCKRIAFIDTCFYNYYQNVSSIMGNAGNFYSEDSIYGLMNRVEYFAENNKNYTSKAFYDFFVSCRWAYFDNIKSDASFAKKIKLYYDTVFVKIKPYIKNRDDFIVLYAFHINVDLFRIVDFLNKKIKK